MTFDTSTYFRLSAEGKRQLRHLAADYDLTLSETLRRVVEDFLSKDGDEQRRVLTQELTQVGEER